MNKRAQTPEDIILMVAFIALIGIGGLAAVYTYNQFYSEVSTMPELNSTAALAAFQGGNTVNTYWDYLILVILIGFAIGAVILGFFIDVHSVFMVIYLIIMLIGLVISSIMQYVWEQVSNDAMFIGVKASHFPITDHLLSNIVVYYIIIAALSFVATYAKTRGDDGR